MRRKKTSKSSEPVIALGSPGYVITSSHTDTPRSLRVRFDIPKDKYKGSNTRDNDIVSRQKSSWLRSMGEQAWAIAVKNEFGVEAIEPVEWATASKDLTPSEQKTRAAYDKQAGVVAALEDKIHTIEGSLEALKTVLKTSSRDSTVHREASENKKALEEDLKKAKAQSRLESKLLTRCKHAFEAAHKKQDARRASADRKSYIAAKMKANAGRLVFPGTVKIAIQSNIVTAHDFDAPNCWPTVKPLQDGGTDSCVLWRDDNNAIIKETSFYGGGKASKDCYVIEMIITELSREPVDDHPGDPFNTVHDDDNDKED